MLLSNLELLNLISNNLTFLPIIKSKSVELFINCSLNSLKFPKMKDQENVEMDELNEFKQVHVDLYHTSPLDIDNWRLTIDTNADTHCRIGQRINKWLHFEKVVNLFNKKKLILVIINTLLCYYQYNNILTVYGVTYTHTLSLSSFSTHCIQYWLFERWIECVKWIAFNTMWFEIEQIELREER
jgi:hypothetical protein